MKIYHYTNYDAFVSHIWPSKSLKYGSFENTNDPTEFVRRRSIPYLANGLQEVADKVFKTFGSLVNNYKPICFSIDGKRRLGWQIPTMWAYYAENHKGVCIELELDRLKLSDVYRHRKIKYVKGIPTLNLFEYAKPDDENISVIIERYISKSENILFFTKEVEWKFEQEYRIVSKSMKDLDISNAITGIYMGIRYDIDHEQIKKIEKLLDGEPIDIYFLELRDINGQILHAETMKERRECVRHGEELYERLKLKQEEKNEP